MPSDKHLQVVEISNFAPGLWTNPSAFLMPGTAAQIMQDCYPQPGGGLRAFYKAHSVSTTGIDKISVERVIGLHARGDVGTTDRHLVTYQFDASLGVGSRARPRLYRMNEAAGETTWTEIFPTGTTPFNIATADANVPEKASFRFFRQVAGHPDDLWAIMVLRYTAATGNGPGLYRLNKNDSSATQKAVEITTGITDAAHPTGALAVHQARVVVGSDGLVVPERVVWSNVGDAATFAAANFLDVEPNQDLPNILAMHSQPPGDLVMLKAGEPIAVIQGDITNPAVRSQLQGIYAGLTGQQDFGVSPSGITFIATDGGVYLTDGLTATNLSEQLNGFSDDGNDPVNSPGDTNHLGDFLFGPHGFVYHWPTKAWFTQTQVSGFFHTIEYASRNLFGVVGTGPNFTLNSVEPFNNTGRLSTFMWKSAPLREPSGRQLTIREVEIVYSSFDANATFAVTVGSQTVTQTLQSTTRGSIRFYFLQQAPILDVKIVSTAGSGANEAPMIEAVKIKYPIATHSF